MNYALLVLGFLSLSLCARVQAQDYGGADANGDDYLSGAEISAAIYPPVLLYSDRLTITLGGQSVEFLHPGPAHSDGQSLEQAQQSVQLSDYSDWLLFNERRENVITSAYTILTQIP
jgi:hypothetical protein